MPHGDTREGKWRGNWRIDWVASTRHTTSKQRGISSITTITTADAHTSAASSRLNWRPRPFKWTRPFRRKRNSGFCACAITFQMQSNMYTGVYDSRVTIVQSKKLSFYQVDAPDPKYQNLPLQSYLKSHSKNLWIFIEVHAEPRMPKSLPT